MTIKNYVFVSELIQNSDGFIPDHLLKKRIDLSDSESILNNEYYLKYDAVNDALILRFLGHDDYFMDDYWSHLDYGELIECASQTQFDQKLNDLKNCGQIYFLVATYEHGLINHYPMRSKKDLKTCRWDTGIRRIFIPSQNLIADFKNDINRIFSCLEEAFIEYSQACNGEIYSIFSEVYFIKAKQEHLVVNTSDSIGGFIGYSNALKELVEAESDCFLHSENLLCQNMQYN